MPPTHEPRAPTTMPAGTPRCSSPSGQAVRSPNAQPQWPPVRRSGEPDDQIFVLEANGDSFGSTSSFAGTGGHAVASRRSPVDGEHVMSRLPQLERGPDPA